MDDSFYMELEKAFYADYKHIKLLRAQYFQFVHKIVQHHKGSPIFDFGCGRGEWLELMLNLGFKPLGVDINQEMINICNAHNLKSIKADGLDHIKKLKNDSQAIVSAFHVIEHIEFDDMKSFVWEAFRVLKPGGLLILETPNPRNLVVSTYNFYLDPTHRRAIPNDLLEMLIKNTGFECHKTLFLNGKTPIGKLKNSPSLFDLIAGMPVDYGIIAQKNPPFKDISIKDIRIENPPNFIEILSKVSDQIENVKTVLNQTKNELEQTKNELEQTKNEVKNIYVFQTPNILIKKLIKRLVNLLIIFCVRYKMTRFPKFFFRRFFPKTYLRIINSYNLKQINSADPYSILGDKNNLSLRAKEIYSKLTSKVNKKEK